MKRTFSTILCLFGIELAAIVIAFFMAHNLGVYFFGQSLVTKVFVRLAVGFVAALAVLECVLALVKRENRLISKQVLIAFPVILVVSEAISFIVLKLVGVIRWEQIGNTHETSFAALMIFTAAAAVLSLALVFAYMKLIEREERAAVTQQS